MRAAQAHRTSRLINLVEVHQSIIILHARLALAEFVYILLSVIELLSGVATSTAEEPILDTVQGRVTSTS